MLPLLAKTRKCFSAEIVVEKVFRKTGVECENEMLRGPKTSWTNAMKERKKLDKKAIEAVAAL